MKILTSLALTLGMIGGAEAATLYSNDFSGGANGFTGAGISTYGGYGAFYGILAQGAAATLSLTGLEANRSLQVAFNLYTLLSLDGDNVAVGPDAFAVLVNGTSIFDYTFSNFPASLDAQTNATQSYGGIGSNAGTNAISGIESQGWTGATEYTYHLILTALSDANGNAEIRFVGNSSQPVSDEGFGIDNVTVSTVPVPAGLPMLAGGLVALGLMRRRKA